MKRRTAAGWAAAVAAGAATVLLMVPGEAVGKSSEPKPSPRDRIEICRDGKTMKVYPDEIVFDDEIGRCPKK
jgi:hypothetical protein